ncbi:isoprenoid biosynthesis glyoxalase ElbB [Vibrio mexicanus]|uniref:isoprenoid biosynthesis glyoxalase ElbB n=1 Tax=Vibrio mexicanus TaxID=1004326 RepID=UPI00063CEB74|nr:isoprenoid biosynthesis glyoxalase ElbB [Vibrio mexicanus]
MDRVAVVLAGCGVFDGAEIQEAVLALHALEELGVEYQCFAPNKDQHHVVNHLLGEEQKQTRNVMEEAGRIVRGNIKPLDSLSANEFDGLLVPGGFGVAKNLSNLAFVGEAVEIDPDFKRVMTEFKEAKKKAGYLCIAPALLPLVYPGVKCTIGNDVETAQVIEKLGGKHVDCAVDDIVIDEANRVITTPAYMLANNMLEAGKGIKKLVEELVS